MAYTDAQLLFSNGQVLDAAANAAIRSDNAIDLGLNNRVAGSGRDIGVGDPLEIFVRIQNVDALGNGSELIVELWTHTADDGVIAAGGTFVSAGQRLYVTPETNVGGIVLPTAALASSLPFVFRVPFGTMEQYLALVYYCSVDNNANCTVTAGIVHTMTKYREYASGLNFAS